MKKKPELTYHQRIATLTEGEAAALIRVVRGWTDAEIGKDLGISSKTVNHYRGKIYRKMAVRNAVQLAVVYLSTGVSTPEKIIRSW